MPSHGLLFSNYCTQRCLRGLLREGLLDENCPNVESHRRRDQHHCLDPSTFHGLMRKQLSENLDDDCYALDIQGSRGALFKIRLTSHGYTIAAKCTIWVYVSDLLHEAAVYEQLEAIQGIHVSACLGKIDLLDVLTYNFVEFVHMTIPILGRAMHRASRGTDKRTACSGPSC